MTIPVWVEQKNGTFTASVPGVPELNAVGKTKDAAVAILRGQVCDGVARGCLVFIDVNPPGLLASAGLFRDDPTLDDIVRDAYRHRDELKAQEYPE